MRKILLLVVFCLGCAVPIMAQDNPATVIHIVQKGDTFESIAARYDTCIQTIIEANKLEQTGIYSSQFLVKEGTPLKILPRSACDDLPTGEYIHTVQKGETQWGISSRYCSYVLDMNGEYDYHRQLEVGEQVIVGHVEIAYTINNYGWCYSTDVLVVYDDNDRLFTPLLTYTIGYIADCYGTTVGAIRQANSRELGAYQNEPFIGSFMGSTYVIPDISQECVLQEQININDDGDVTSVAMACYPQLLEQIAGLPLPNTPTYNYQDAKGRYCYFISQAYTILFQPLDLEWFVWTAWTTDVNPNSAFDYVSLGNPYFLYKNILYSINWTLTDFDTSAWKLKSLDNPDWKNLARCIGVSVDEIRTVNEKQYYPAGIVPPTPISQHYYLVPKPRRPCYLFQPELLQTQHIHKVKWDETLSGIAARYDLLTITLAQVNNLADWNDIRAGELLVIPDHPTRTELAQVTGVTGTSTLLVWFVRLRWRKRRGLDKRKRAEK